ncbi:MAG: mercury(II) reductase [Thermoprotei archaeon]
MIYVETFDLVIIGGGSAAFAAAIKASEFDASVAMIERSTIGGTCVNVGCVPSKRMLRVGEVYYYSDYNYSGIALEQGALNFEAIVRQKDDIVLDLRATKYSDVLKSLSNATLIKGSAKFVSKDHIDVNGQIIRGKKFIVATGSSPRILSIEGINKVDYLTNVEALSLRELPKSMLIIGGRALALEFAQMYAHFGTNVTVLQRSPRIIPNEEPEISEALRTYLEDEGIEIHTGVTIKRVQQRNGSKIVIAQIEGKERDFEAEQLLIATGRIPNTSNLGLERVGVKLREDGAILVNDEMRTTAPNIWAAGDVTGQPMLEPVAAKEGAIAAENALSNAGRKMDFSAVPHAIFTTPQVASVGMTEAQVVAQGYICNCRVLDMSLVPKAKIIGDTRGLIKMVTDYKTGRILGVHILSYAAAEIIHEAVLAVKFKLTIDDIIDTVHIFPTMAESIKLAALSFKKDISKVSCCVE